jgi:GNAT superfamily N-acetyltransferase
MMIIDIAEPDDSRLTAFYDLYSRIFVLEEEREPLDAIRTILRLNREPAVQAEFGPLREQIAVALDPATGAAIGLANYILYAYPRAAGRFDGSCQLNFLCVDPGHRGRGLAGRLLEHVDERLRGFVAAETGSSSPLAFITIEQNNPARMTPEQRRADLDAAGIAPERRSRWWAAKGYRRLDFPYRQPPLSADVEACAYLDYYARVPGDADLRVTSLPADRLAEHLRRFFFVSVGKLAVDMEANPEWLAQKAYLSGRSEVALTTAGAI